jgi:copper transport protein
MLSAVGLALAAPRAVSAHGVLLSSTPAANAELPVPPDRIELRFNEIVHPRLSAASLVRDGTRRPLGLLAADGSRLVFRLPALTPGIYIVDWRVISAVDGHLTRGAFAFGIGEAAAPSTSAGVPGPPWHEVTVRWLGLVGVFLLLGGIGAYLWLPALPGAEVVIRDRLFGLVAAGAAASIAAGFARTVIDAAAIADGPAAGQWLAAAVRVLGLSPTGHDVLFRIPAAAFLVVLLRAGRPIERAGVIAVLSVLLIGPSLTSHGLSTGLFGILLGAVHLAAASLWVGGLLFFGAIYLPAAHRVNRTALRPAALQFSRAALAAVGVLLVTGTAQAWLYAGPPLSLPRSPYGRMLLVKLIVLTPLLSLAAFNRWRLVPGFLRMPPSGTRASTVVLAEAALGFLVALLAAGIAITQPPALGADAPDASMSPRGAPGTCLPAPPVRSPSPLLQSPCGESTAGSRDPWRQPRAAAGP